MAIDIQLISDYAGLVVGLVVLLLATSVLPGKIRWYVLTAGLAIIGYEFYVRMRNRKALAAADKARKELLARFEALEKHRKELAETVVKLNQKAAELSEKNARLELEKQTLAQQGGDIAVKKAELDNKSTALLDEAGAVVNEINNSENLLQTLLAAKQAHESLAGAGTADVREGGQ
ncbi:MAG: hypothetical protein OEY07_07385 [Gammaproteobacteria bacterium]|nr:hypothetical protein [Gammaproteobacteria bacterium]